MAECCGCLEAFSAGGAQQGVWCDRGPPGRPRHFICLECFDRHVRAGAAEDMAALERRAGCVRCPHGRDCDAPPFEDIDVARLVSRATFAAHQRARERVLEARVLQQAAAQSSVEMRAKVKRLEELGPLVYAARAHILEEVLTLKCPRCGQAWLDWDGCMALTCSAAGCGCGFCGWCLKDCGANAHAHIRERCTAKAAGADQWHPKPPQYRAAWQRRWARMVRGRLDAMDPELARATVRNIRAELLGAGLAGVVEQYEGMRRSPPEVGASGSLQQPAVAPARPPPPPPRRPRRCACDYRWYCYFGLWALIPLVCLALIIGSILSVTLYRCRIFDKDVIEHQCSGPSPTVGDATDCAAAVRRQLASASTLCELEWTGPHSSLSAKLQALSKSSAGLPMPFVDNVPAWVASHNSCCEGDIRALCLANSTSSVGYEVKDTDRFLQLITLGGTEVQLVIGLPSRPARPQMRGRWLLPPKAWYQTKATHGQAILLLSHLHVADEGCDRVHASCASDQGIGGAIQIQSGGLVAQAVTFQRNTAAQAGGAIFVAADGIATLRQCVFDSNIAANSGGAILVDSGGVALLSECVFNGNSAGVPPSLGDGGAISSRGRLIVRSSFFAQNTARTWGGAISIAPADKVHTSSFTISNSTAEANTAALGAAISSPGSFGSPGCAPGHLDEAGHAVRRTTCVPPQSSINDGRSRRRDKGQKLAASNESRDMARRAMLDAAGDDHCCMWDAIVPNMTIQGSCSGACG
jgi:predicted outer membrane repeat protein